ncbi:MAG TPA: hypothetical protein VKE70_02905 [Candidatus Solibacter sp.]|nr:hypothetical protein [Candidatus Solibacter sp.]
MSDFGQAPAPENLQFQKAEPLPVVDPNAQRCKVCQTPIGATYFHANGQVVCPMCAERINAGQQKPPAISLATAVIYGAGAAIAGSALYAAVAILLHVRLGIVAIAIGYMVGKAVRAGSKGLGGRPQQILAVLLTYFSITTSYVVMAIYAFTGNLEEVPHLLATLMMLLIAAPFFSLSSNGTGFISLIIIFFGLQQAWKLTGRTEVMVLGPYETATKS